MAFPILKGTLTSNDPPSTFLDRIVHLMHNSTSVKVKTNRIAYNELVLQFRSVYWLERNSFLPDVRIISNTNKKNTTSTVEYSLQMGTRILVIAYSLLAIAFEIMLLCLCDLKNNSFILLIPIGLILFSTVVCGLGFVVSCQKVHREILSLCNEGEQLKIVFKKVKESSSINSQH